MRFHILAIALLLALPACKESRTPTPEKAPAPVKKAEAAEAVVKDGMVLKAEVPCTNACKDYSVSWQPECPEGKRCLAFTNHCTYKVGMTYQVGCNSDGTKGAPQCDCTTLPDLEPGKSTFWVITNADFKPGDCRPWEPPCLTEGFEVMAHKDEAECTSGTRIEFSAGNTGDIYGKFDSYNIDTELGFSVPVKVAPAIGCAIDHANHDCRPLWCGDIKCPDAYANPTQGGCADGRSPQGGCQDTFNQSKGYTIEFCPTDCTEGKCPSCQDAKACGD